MADIEIETPPVFTTAPADIEENDFDPGTGPAHALAASLKKSVVGGPSVADPHLEVWSLKRFNPRTPEQAIAAAQREAQRTTRNWKGLCAKSTAVFYGWGGSGEVDARTLWYSQALHHANGVPPRGALVFWKIGQHWHVALSAGNGRCYSVDIIRVGKVNLVDIDDIAHAWGALYLGWSLPFYPKAWGPTGPLITITKPAAAKPVSISKAIAASKSGQAYDGITTISKALRNKAGYKRGFRLNGVWGSGKRATWIKWCDENGINNKSGDIGVGSLKALAKLAGIPLVP